MLDPLPIIDVPLADKDTVRVDFGVVYQRTFASSRLFWQIQSDRTQSLDGYTQQDQQKIRNHKP